MTVAEECVDVFRTIRATANSKLENQQQAILLLRSTEEVIRGQNLEPTVENYFKALWPLLCDDSREAKLSVSQAEHLNGATIYLLSFVFPRLGVEFVASEYSTLYSMLPYVIERYRGSAAFLRSAFVVLKSILVSFSREDWAEKTSLVELAGLLLRFSIDARPKVRKGAQEALIAVLQSFANAGHPFSRIVLQQGQSLLQSATRKDPINALHFMPLLKCPLDAAIDLEPLVEATVHCMSLGNTHLSVAVFQLIEHIGVDFRRSKRAPTADIQGLLKGLLQHQPQFELAELSHAWLPAYASLVAMCWPDHDAFLPLLSAYDSSHVQVREAAQLATINLCEHICEHCHSPKLFDELIEMLEKGLRRGESRLASPHLIITIAHLLQSLGSHGAERTERLVRRLAELHDVRNFGSRKIILEALSQYVRAHGPVSFLKVVPLDLEPSKTLDKNAVPRAWLLPMLKESISNTSLGYFIDELVPLADRLSAKANEYLALDKKLDARVYETVVYQIWTLLPAFMTHPTDFAAVFSRFAERIGRIINDDVQLRVVVCSALLQHIQRCKNYQADLSAGLKLVQELSTEEIAGNLECLSVQAKNFLPLFFNVFNAQPFGQREYLLNTIEAFISISDGPLVRSFYKKMMVRLMELGALAKADGELLQEYVSLLDLSVVMLPYLEADAYQVMIRVLLPMLNVSSPVLQKRAYKALVVVFERPEFRADLMHAHLDQVEEGLAGSMASLQSSSKKKRFRLLANLAPILPGHSLHWVTIFMPEAILGTKEVNHKTRHAAFDLLVGWAERMKSGGTICKDKSRGSLLRDTKATLSEYFLIVSAGLAGSTPHMISATLMALARLLFEYHQEIMHEDILVSLLANATVTLHSASREVVKSALGFLKVAIIALEPQVLSPHLERIVEGLLNWSKEHHQNFKVRVRHMMERLVRRFGVEEVLRATPTEHHKLLINIRKQKERSRRRKNSAVGHGDEEADGADGNEMVGTRHLKKSFNDTMMDSASEDEDEDEGDLDGSGDDDRVPALRQALARKLRLANEAKTVPLNEAWLQEHPSGDGGRHAKKTGKGRLGTEGPEARIEETPDGRLMIHGSDEDGESASEAGDNPHQLYMEAHGLLSTPGRHVKHAKAQRSALKARTGQEHVNSSALGRKRPLHSVAPSEKQPSPHGGRTFAAKRAKGDARKKDAKFEPYAYVPLQGKQQTGREKKTTKARYFMDKKAKC